MRRTNEEIGDKEMQDIKPVEELTDEDLSGPRVDRRTTLSLLSAIGATSLAGCSGKKGGKGTKSEKTAQQQMGTSNEDTSTSSGSKSGKRGGSITAAWYTGAVKKLDPRRISTGAETQVAGNINNGLVETSPKLEILPDFAKDWSVENKTRWTFNLRKGVKYHEGYGEATAQDLEFYIKSVFNKPSRVRSKLEPLKPLDEGGVKAIDDYTLQIETTKPYAPILIFMARGDGRACVPIPKKAVEDKGREKFLTHPVGTGPYKIAEHDVNSKVVLERFDDYWETDDEGTQLPYLDKITIKPLSEAATIISGMKAGGIDFAQSIPKQNLSETPQDFEVMEGVGSWNGLGMNCMKEPFTDPEVRLAFAKLIDQEAFVKTALLGNAQPAWGPISPMFGWCYREDKPGYQNYAPEKGKKILKDKGVFNREYEITVATNQLRMAKVFQQQLSSRGLNVKINSLPTTQFWNQMHKTPPSYDFSIMGDAADLDPDASIYQQFGAPPELEKDGKGAFNDTMFNNAEVNKLLQQARETVNRDERAKLYEKAEDVIMKKAPFAFTHFNVNFVGVGPDLKGYEMHTINRDLFDVWKTN